MNHKALIKNGIVINPAEAGKAQKKETDEILDLRLEDGVIVEVGANLAARADETIFDASGLWILPGFVDIHTHLRDFEQSDSEDIESGTRAAAAGGFTTVLAMANSKPVVDSPLVLRRLLQMIEEKACIKVLPVAAVTKNLEGKELTSMIELAEIGAAAFSDDGQPVTNLAVLSRALLNATLANRLIISHPEDKDLSAGGAINECAASARLGLPGVPAASESACIAREIEVVRSTGSRLHFAHVSTRASVEAIRRAKKEGLSVTADVTPHHLVLSDAAIIGFDTNFKMNPPLRSQADQEALVDGIIDGTIDAIGTDHAPHPLVEKQRPFVEAPFGVIGLETAFSLVHERLVAQGHIGRAQLIGLLTTKPAAILQIDAPIIAAGKAANLTFFNPKTTWQYDAAKSFSKSANTPFSGRSLHGRIILTLAQGKIVYQLNDETETRLNTRSAKASKHG
jgi:dihydroorotase